MGDLIVAERLQGFAGDKGYRRARDLLLELPYADLVGRNIALAVAMTCCSWGAFDRVLKHEPGHIPD
jgi:hypothetical protein